ncbi:MAG TPA: TauD/TfdA family dioxygenase [Pyrinomonadaceae bacterium]|jgi:alpha-ketoglutarate-dependent taurine dioxygenase
MSSTGEFKPARRKAVRLTSAELVKTSYLDEGRRGPLVIEPNGGDVNLVSWAEARREFVEAELSKHGALLLRGFGVDSVERFEQFVAATSGGALPYGERSSPRSQVSGNIYTSTDYPAAQRIFLHNEQSYNLRFPLKIYFFCLTPPARGGETPVADTRRILAAVPPEIRERFARRGYTYARNFGDGLGLSWQDAFQTRSRADVERYCREHEISFEWKPGNRLRTRQTRPAVARHPRTGELAWFNHATFFHVSTLEGGMGERLLREFGEDDLPNQTYYGDGEPIEPETARLLREIYLREKFLFAWRQYDVLMLDNVLCSHGREPFEGPRRVVTGMADPCSWEDALPPPSGAHGDSNERQES